MSSIRKKATDCFRRGCCLILLCVFSGCTSSTGTTSTGAPKPGDDFTMPLGADVVLAWVWVPALQGWCSKYEVTNDQYTRCRPRHGSGQFRGRSLAHPRQPVVQIPYEDGMDGAVPFARWVEDILRARGWLPDRYEVRLPNSEEWELLACCGNKRDYPWGKNWPPEYGNYADQTARALLGDTAVIQDYDDGFEVSCDVEQSGANEWGLYGMSGNVWEWTQDRRGFGYAIKGGSWLDRDPAFLNVDGGYVIPRSYRFEGLGFRLLLLPKDASP